MEGVGNDSDCNAQSNTKPSRRKSRTLSVGDMEEETQKYWEWIQREEVSPIVKHRLIKSVCEKLKQGNE